MVNTKIVFAATAACFMLRYFAVVVGAKKQPASDAVSC